MKSFFLFVVVCRMYIGKINALRFPAAWTEGGRGRCSQRDSIGR